ncbi:MAG: hypothetical protein AAGI72_18735 [Pseudomonadota bacterium]
MNTRAEAGEGVNDGQPDRAMERFNAGPTIGLCTDLVRDGTNILRHPIVGFDDRSL